jgi:hypothetical protein
MATYIAHINERMTAGKQAIAYLKSVPEAVSFRKITKREAAALEGKRIGQKSPKRFS